MTPSHSAALVAPSLDRTPSISVRLFHAYAWIARRELLACAVVLFLTLAIRAALLPWDPPPLPTIHDEFSYLLAADTYASGRLANPPHPLWQHFETEHELMQPAYASKYPPLQGLVLAFGEKFFGQPWVGVYLSAGLMCAAICWMLQGWVAANFAFLGGILFALHCGIFGYWMNSYWGGAVPAIGGALVLGALVRIWRRQQALHWITLAAGLAILMHSRPWEGAVLGLETVAVLAWAWRKFPFDFRAKSLTAAIPALLLLGLSLGAVAYNNRRVAGSALLLPQALYDQQYIVAPNFSLLPLRPAPVYRHEMMRRLFNDWYVDEWRTTRGDLLNTFLERLSRAYDFFFGLWPLLIPPLIWPYPLKTTEERVTALLLAGFLLAAVFPLSGFQVHYAAPIAGLLYVRLLQTLSRLNQWRPHGRPLGPAVALVFTTLFVYQFALDVFILFRLGVEVSPFALARNAMAQELAGMPGQQLVFVRYAPDHRVHDEWVWNRADIDKSQTVWARAMDGSEDAALLRYYPDRKAWLLEPDQQPVKLVPYPGSP
jgi:hypothetical protein